MKKFLLIMPIICVLFSSCFPTGEKNIEKIQYSDIAATADSIINLSIDDMKLPDSYPEIVPEIRVTLKEWDNDVLSVISDDATISETIEYPSDRVKGNTYKVDMLDNNFFVNYETGRIYYGRFYPNNEYTEEELTTTTQSRTGAYIVLTYSADLLDVPELDGFKKVEATRRLQTIFSALDITCFGEPMVYTVTAEYANSLENDYNLSDNDGFYCMVYPICFENIPLVYNTSLGIEGSDYPFAVSSCAKIIVSKDRIVELDMDFICENEFEKVEDVHISVSPEDALNVIVSDYKYRKLDHETVFNSCRLVYVPVETDEKYSFTYSPAWEFEGYIKLDFGNKKITEIVYADTGRRYIGNE